MLRRLLLATSVLALAVSALAGAQSTRKPARIGVLGRGAPTPETSHLLQAFREGLRDRGHVEGQSLGIEWRWAEGRAERLDLAGELVHREVDVLVTQGTPETAAAQRATRAIPIVMVYVGDPVGAGFVASLGRPGGNITGLSFLFFELIAKQLELLHEALPETRRLAVLWNPGNPSHARALKEVDRTAQAMDVRLEHFRATRPEQFDEAFAAMSRSHVPALLVAGDPMFFQHRSRLATLAVQRRLPTMFNLREHIEAGGLLSYGVQFTDLYRRAAGYVDRILRGAKPADLPVEQPDRFELIVNLRTARAIGMAVPQSILLRADTVLR